jgi:hypothetical protein
VGQLRFVCVTLSSKQSLVAISSLHLAVLLLVLFFLIFGLLTVKTPAAGLGRLPRGFLVTTA